MRDTRLRMQRGDAASFEIRATKGDGTPQSLVGATVWFTAKNRLADADPGAIQKSTTGGGVMIVDGPGGVARVDLAAADTAGFAQPTTLHWDVQAKDAANKVMTLARGRLEVRLDVTRAT